MFEFLFIIIIIYSLGTITMYNELPNLLAGITYYIIYITTSILFFVLSISETVFLAYIFHSLSQMTTMLVVGVGQVWLSDCCWTSDALQCCLSLLCGLHTCAAGCAQMSPGLSFCTSLVDHCLCAPWVGFPLIGTFGHFSYARHIHCIQSLKLCLSHIPSLACIYRVIKGKTPH